MFLRIVENKHSKVLSLPSGGSVSVRLPTAHSIEEPGAKATSRRNPNKFVAVKIGDAQVRVSSRFTCNIGSLNCPNNLPYFSTPSC